MKLLKTFFRNIEQKSKLDLITELLTLETSTPEAIDLYEKVKANFREEMKRREKQANYEIKLIDLLDEDQNVFDRPISEIEVR